MDKKDEILTYDPVFAYRLKQLCADFKQESIAYSTHCTRQAVSSYVNGKRTPDAQFLWDLLHTINEENIANGYDRVNANYLFGLSEDMFDDSFNIVKTYQFTNETILNLKNSIKTRADKQILNILLQNRGLSTFLKDIRNVIYNPEFMNSQLDSRTAFKLMEFDLTKITNKFISVIIEDIKNNDSLTAEYNSLLKDIDICKKFISGELQNDSDTIKMVGRRFEDIYNAKSDDDKQKALAKREDKLKEFQKNKLKKIKSIYRDRINFENEEF